MILDVILGKNIDTFQWIKDLKESGADHVIVLDYDLVIEYEILDGIFYIAPFFAKKYIQDYDTVNYYRSLYVYPGMSGYMSSLQNRKRKKT